MFEGFYITIADCKGMEVAPDTGYSGLIVAGTPIACTYFDEHGMEFIDKEHGEFRLTKPCPIVVACSCDICGKIVATRDLECHKGTDDNCLRIAEMNNPRKRSPKEDELVGINANQPVLKVWHKRLKRIDGSNYRSQCPKCQLGTLLMHRTDDGDLDDVDNCVLCGQQIKYMDLNESGLM